MLKCETCPLFLRSYQPTRTFDEGLQLLHDLEGELDPQVVTAFARAYRIGKIVRHSEAPRHVRGSRNPVPA